MAHKNLIQSHGLMTRAIFSTKAGILRWVRRLREWPCPVPFLTKGEKSDFSFLLAESKSSLWNRQDPRELKLTLGKIHNLRVAAARLNHLKIPSGKIFSFWRQLGKLTARKGYVVGRELREGCLVPSVGGGICQLSNALYDVGLQANFEIVERHAHTQVLPNSLAMLGKDATVFWNYVDFRMCPPGDVLLSVVLNESELIVQIWGAQPKTKVAAEIESCKPADLVNSCDTCGQSSCSQALIPDEQIQTHVTGYIVDEYWPEFDDWIQIKRQAQDVLLRPLDGKCWRKRNYEWSDVGFEKTISATWQTLRWAKKQRGLKNQGALRQRSLLQRDQSLAESFAKRISWTVSHCVVMQNFLPFLWRSGVLQGRSFDVLMTRLPFKILHAVLDDAHQNVPQSKTLGDFRVDDDLVQIEWLALEKARCIVTPHVAIAKIFPKKTILLPWQEKRIGADQKSKRRRGQKIVFPATTVSRKGAEILREAIRSLDVELVVVGEIIESPDFWAGLSWQKKSWDEEWWQDAACVVLPAFVESKPRALLQALSLGIPVIASEACGLTPQTGLMLIPLTNSQEWSDAIRLVLLKNS